MRSSTLVFLVIICAGALAAHAADATSPVDATQRSAPYAPAATVVPGKQAPADNTNQRVQGQRIEPPVVDRQTSPLTDQRAAIDIAERREKNVREKESHRPEAAEQPLSAYNHRESRYATSTPATKPPTVAKYQDSIAAASASNMARFPALEGATAAKINRFVFRKNAAESPGVTNGAAITPAAGGSPIQK